MTEPGRAMRGGVEITWVGHATVLFDIDGFRVITDPVLTRRVAHLRRRRALPDPSVGDVDLVLLSHAHMDHLHLPSLRRFRRTTPVIAAAGSGSLLHKAGFSDVTEVVVDDRVDAGPVKIEVVPAAHKSGRGPHTRVEAPPVGYVIDTGERRFYFAGDTDLFAGMSELHAIDVAFLPIWGWGPNIGGGHLDPARAAEATRLIRPRIVVPMHWGTYAPEDGRRRQPLWLEDPMGHFADELTEIGEHDRLHVLEPGGSLAVPKPAKGPS